MSVRWLPAKNGKRRGLEVSSSGILKWASIPLGKKRSTSIYLNKKVSKITTSNNIVKVYPKKKSIGGRYPVVITAHAVGTTTLSVGGANLVVTVHPRRTVKVAFRNVLNDPSGKANDWKAKFKVKDVKRMLGVANAIFSWQGNLRFVPVGSPKLIKKKITGLQYVTHFKDDVDPKAHVTVFFVDDCDIASTAANEWAVQWQKLLLMEASISAKTFDLVFCHELGHFLGLPHPTGTPHKNLMNQTSKAATYGGRDRYGSFLTRSQIEKVVNPCNWRNPKKHKCKP